MSSNDLNSHYDPDSQNGHPPSSLDASLARPSRKILLLKILAIFVVAVLLLTLLLPTLASTGVARQMAVNWLNSKMSYGQAHIKDWSFSWRNGLDIQGITFEDASGAHLLDIGRVTSPVSPWRLFFGKPDFGNAQITGVDFNARIDKSGQLNLLNAFKPSTGPTFLPDIKGTFHISSAAGTLNDEIAYDSWVFDSIDAIITIKDINQPIDQSVTATVRLMNRPLGVVSIDGNLFAKNGILDPSHLSASENIALARADIASFSSLLRRWHHDVQVVGTLDTTLRLTLTEDGNLAYNGMLSITDPSVTGEDLKGDTVYYSNVFAPFSGSFSADRLQLNLPVTAISTATTRPDHIEMHMDIRQDSLRAASRVLVTLLNRSLKGESDLSAPVGNNGTLHLQANFDRNYLMFQLPDVFHLTPSDLFSASLSHVRAASMSTSSTTEPSSLRQTPTHP